MIDGTGGDAADGYANDELTDDEPLGEELDDGEAVTVDTEQLADLRSAEVVEEIKHRPGGLPLIRRILVRGVVLAVGVLLLYLVQQELFDILSSVDQLRDVEVGWIVLMVVFETISFLCMWWLIKEMLPGVSWFVAATSQLVSNSVSRVVPGGAAVGGASLYRMLEVSGVAAPQAASAMAATSILSNALLFAIPTAAGLLALAGAPVPERLLPAAFVGAVFFVVLMALGVIAVRYTRPLRAVGRFTARSVYLIGRLFDRRWRFDAERVVTERDRLVEVLGPRWPKAVGAAAGNWAFDYLALIAALYAVGAEPRLSLVLLAFATASVLTMMPFTPGGVGFVEVGLYSTLTLSGISQTHAGLATIVYRLVSWLFPVLSGLAAWFLFRMVYPPPNADDHSAVNR